MLVIDFGYYSGNTELMPKTITENASGADNQQERLISGDWIIGFVEGEGCFSIGFVKQPGGKTRRGYSTGIQVWHEFVITQGESSLSALQKIERYFGVGKIYLNKRHDNHREHLYRYVVRKREDLLNVIIPFFNQHTMHTFKKKQFERFDSILKMIATNDHLTLEGLVKIIHISEKMNSRKNRDELIRILREHTSQS